MANAVNKKEPSWTKNPTKVIAEPAKQRLLQLGRPESKGGYAFNPPLKRRPF